MAMNFDLETTRRNLIHQRTAHAGNKAVTTRLSTLIEQLENYQNGTGDTAMLDKLIEQSTAELATLAKGHH